MRLQDCGPDGRCCISRPSRRDLPAPRRTFMAWGCPSSPCRGKSPGEWQFIHRGCRRTGTSAVKSDPSRLAGGGAELFFAGGSAAAKDRESSREQPMIAIVVFGDPTARRCFIRPPTGAWAGAGSVFRWLRTLRSRSPAQRREHLALRFRRIFRCSRRCRFRSRDIRSSASRGKY